MTVNLLEQEERARLELASRKHSPTRAMQIVAKRGLKQASSQDGLDTVALAVGRKIASGQQLTGDHVEQIASYHAAHDGNCPTSTDKTSTEDMLWGGAPGASWASTRCAAMDAADLAEDATPTLLALDEEGKDISLEIFVRDGIGGEPMQFDAEGEGDGLVWAPILRSGTLATRPGPGGQKVHKPLTFVPGHSNDPRQAIGLQDIVDAFDDGAIQHVTVPRSHENDLLDNTGFIKGLKIVPSTLRPGEQVLMAGHKFTEPEVAGKVQRGTIANRSCGLLYDYVNTETGKTYPVALEHVALTNKPWVTGMAAYGEVSETNLADRQIVPMLLSESPSLHLGSGVTDGPWDGSASRFSDQQYARSCVLDRGADAGSAKDRYSLPIREPDGTLNKNAVSSAAAMINKVKGASGEQKKTAARKLIAAYKTIGEEPPAGLRKMVSAGTNMSDADRRRELWLADVAWGDEPSLQQIKGEILSQFDAFRASRNDEIGYPYYYVMDVTPSKALVQIDYGDSDGANDAWVVPFEADSAGVRLSDFSEWQPVEQKWVTDDDAARDKQELGSILGDTSLLPSTPPSEALSERDIPGLRLSQERLNQQGGACMPVTKEQLDRLNLDEGSRAVVQQLLDQNQQLSTQLSDVTAESRKGRVAARVKELQEKGFTPGFCKTYERIALGDDGQAASALNLSADDNAQPVAVTATQIADALVNALPLDKDTGKLALAESGSLLESPISERPPANAADQTRVEEQNGERTAPQSADEWLAQAEKAVPGIAAQSGLQLSTTTKEA